LPPDVSESEDIVPEFVPLVLVVLVGLVILVAVAVVGFLRKGLARVPLWAAALLASMAAPLLAVWVVSHRLSVTLGGLAASSDSAQRVLPPALLDGTSVLLAGVAGACLACGFFALLLIPSLFAREAEEVRPRASFRRSLLLGTVAIAVCLGGGALFEYTRQTMELTRLVVLVDAKSVEGRAAAESYDVLGTRGSGGIAAVSARIARGVLVGALGAPFLLAVVAGAGLAALLIAWPVRGSRTSAGVGLVFLLLFTAGTAICGIRLGLEIHRIRQGPVVSRVVPT